MKGFICWDTSVLIDHIKGGEDSEREESLKSVVCVLDNGDYGLILSTLLYVEVLKTKMGKTYKKFEDFMENRGKFRLISVNREIARKAQEIRNDTGIKTPDAIHVATAIIGGAKFFHTFDRKLLNLNESSAIKGVQITPCKLTE